jgi:hypothetical protein
MIVLWCALALASCSADRKLTRAEDTLKLYAQQIRWSMFDGATQLIDLEKHPEVDPTPLKNIRVVAYNPVMRMDDMESNTILQSVAISYYDDRTARQRDITDRQIWRYDEKKKRWRLDGGLPAFK